MNQFHSVVQYMSLYFFSRSLVLSFSFPASFMFHEFFIFHDLKFDVVCHGASGRCLLVYDIRDSSNSDDKISS